MGKYRYGKGRRRVIEEFTHRQGLWILAVLGALAMGTCCYMSSVTCISTAFNLSPWRLRIDLRQVRERGGVRG
jgi:hypothetical protein